MQIRAALLIAGLVLSLPTMLLAQVLRAGPEFQVNQFTNGAELFAAVAPGVAGGFVITWSSPQDNDAYGIVGRRFDANGMAIGGEFPVNTYTTGNQILSRVAADAAGNFVVVWRGYDAVSEGIAGRRFDSSGAPLGPEFQVNEYTTSTQLDPSVAVDGSGNFVVVWSSYGQDGDSFGVFARRFDNTGAPLTGDFQVNQYTTSVQAVPGIDMDTSGNFVVAWNSYGQDQDGYAVVARRYDNTGAALGPEFQVNSYTTSAQRFGFTGLVASDAAGDFVISWMSYHDGDSRGVFARRFDSTGAPLGTDFQVNTYTTGSQYPFALASAPDGNFVVSWIDFTGIDGDGTGSVARRYSSTGAPLTDEFQVNAYTTSFQYTTGVIQDDAGNIVFVSDSFGQDGDADGVFAQRFAAPRVLLGKRLLVKDPNGSESSRGTLGLAKETASDIGPLAGDPVANGASLRVVVNGMVPSDQTYALDAGGWSAIGTGFKYSGPTGGDGDPVKKVLLKLTPGGTALMKVLLKGSIGTQLLNLLPPNPGVSGEVILSINGGGATYCTAFGGAAGGNITTNSVKLFKITNPSAQDCPEP
jgi:hypothetical protein